MTQEKLSKHQFSQAVEVLTLAFENDVMKKFFISDGNTRSRFTRWISKGTVRYCARYGLVQLSPGLEGAACWLSPGKTSMSPWGMFTSWDIFPNPWLLVGRKTVREFFDLQDFTESAHKRLMPGRHWYLLALGVKPGCQGQGIGGKLLAPMLTRLDKEQTPAYLETQTEQNVEFYQRRGFEVLEQVSWRGLNLWLMLRQPQPLNGK